MGSLYVGCAGWAIPREFSSEFPGRASHLERYAQVLRCAEINSSFYRPHRTSTWDRWANTVPLGFRFSVKAPRTMTHGGALFCSDGDLTRFLDQALLLGARLGPILFQTPPKLGYEHSVVRKFFSSLRAIYPGQVVIEPRNPSWFSADVDCLLSEFNVARVAADPSPTPEGESPGGSRTLSYYRLHGSPRKYYSSYSEEELARLALSLLSLSHHGDVWCVFDNTGSGAATGNALRLSRLLEGHH